MLAPRTRDRAVVVVVIVILVVAGRLLAEGGQGEKQGATRERRLGEADILILINQVNYT